MHTSWLSFEFSMVFAVEKNFGDVPLSSLVYPPLYYPESLRIYGGKLIYGIVISSCGIPIFNGKRTVRFKPSRAPLKVLRHSWAAMT